MADDDLQLPPMPTPDLPDGSKSKQATSDATQATVATRQAQQSRTSLQPPAYGFERFVERGLATAGPRSSRFNKGRQTGGRFSRPGHPLHGLSKGEAVEKMRDMWRKLPAEVKAKYTGQANFTDVTTPAEKKQTDAYRRQQDQLATGSAGGTGTTTGAPGTTAVSRPRPQQTSRAVPQGNSRSKDQQGPGIYQNGQRVVKSPDGSDRYVTEAEAEKMNRRSVRQARNDAAVEAGRGKVKTPVAKSHAERYGKRPNDQGGYNHVGQVEVQQRQNRGEGSVRFAQTVNKTVRRNEAMKDAWRDSPAITRHLGPSERQKPSQTAAKKPQPRSMVAAPQPRSMVAAPATGYQGNP